jgi:hypothetical protein
MRATSSGTCSDSVSKGASGRFEKYESGYTKLSYALLANVVHLGASPLPPRDILEPKKLGAIG